MLCPRCGSGMKLIALITDPPEVAQDPAPPAQDRQGPAWARSQRAELNLSSTPVSYTTVPFCLLRRQSSRIPRPHSGLPLAPSTAVFFRAQHLPETARRGCSL